MFEDGVSEQFYINYGTILDALTNLSQN
jgi:hypothetical protein